MARRTAIAIYFSFKQSVGRTVAVAAAGEFLYHSLGMGGVVAILATGDRAVVAFVAEHAFQALMPRFSGEQGIQCGAMAGAAGRRRGVRGKMHGAHRDRCMGKLVAHCAAPLDRALG